MDFNKNYYTILGVTKEATRQEIKAAYRRLVIKHHPDRNPDDPTATDRIKEINEAYEMLKDDISRHIYDEYKKNEEKIKDAEKNNHIPEQNKRQYKKTTIQREEQRIYIKGKIRIKFWAEQDDYIATNILREIHYKLNPVEATATITDSDIHPINAPKGFAKSYSEAELFKAPIPQPIKCQILKSDNKEYYLLSINDIRIIKPALEDIVKHDNQSLGTLSGEFYGYVLRIDEEEIIEIVTECSGETGTSERKLEGGDSFIRKEYYNKDCTKFWGPWVRLAKDEYTKSAKPAFTTAANSKSVFDLNGCLDYLWIPVLLILLIAFPKLMLLLTGLILLGLLLSSGAVIFSRIFPFLGLLIIGLLIFSAFRMSNTGSTVKRNYKPIQDTFITRYDPIIDSATNDSITEVDTLIRHELSWTDFDSNLYRITLAVKSSDVRTSANEHAGYDIQFGTTLNPAYHYLEKRDQDRLQMVYAAFDSIRVSDTLGEMAFAKMVVSCIQSIPYYLVTERSCSDDFSDDEFTTNYLRNCNRECCIGSQRYGIRSPAEFIGDLKGDCDTRALVIYSILKEFKYDVAILCSEYYKHAVVGVHFKSETLNGISLNINGKNYYLWETTSTGFQPGQIPPENANLSFWEVGLLNETKN